MAHRPLLCVDDESSNLATLRQLLRDSSRWCSPSPAAKRWRR